MKKRIISLILSAILIVSMAACSSSGGNQKPTTGDNVVNAHALQMDEFIGMVGTTFGYEAAEIEEELVSGVKPSNKYYNAIQTCAAWEVIDADSFDASKGVTWRDAVETGVRAVGLEDIANANNVGPLSDDLVDFFSKNIASFSTDVLDQPIDSANAQIVLNAAREFYSKMEYDPVLETDYKDDVIEIEASDIKLKGDGKNAYILNDKEYKVGDILYVKPSATSTPMALKVESVDGNLITYEQAPIDDVFDSLVVKGTYDGVVVSAVSPDEIDSVINVSSVDQIPGHESNSDFLLTGFSTSKNGVTYTGKIGDVDIEIDISNIKVTTDFDWGFLTLKSAKAELTFTDKIEVDYKFDKTMSKTINLGKIVVEIGPTPLTVIVSVDLVVGIDGELTLTYTSDVSASVNYKKKAGLSQSINITNESLDFHAEVTISIQPTLKVDLRALGVSVVNIKFRTGVVAVAKVDVDILGDNPACIDLLLYVPMWWGVNQDSCAVTAISKKLKYDKTIWNSENSRIKKHFHWEDGKEVGECTRGQGEEFVQDDTDENGKPWEPEAYFEDYEEFECNILWLTSGLLYLKNGETGSIGISEMPEGYSESDFTYSCDNSSVCTVSGAMVTAVGTGTAVVTVTSTDGKYKATFAVVVAEDYNDTSDFEELDFTV